MEKVITLADIKNNKEFNALIFAANECLREIGYTEHGLRHVGYVSKTTGNILRNLGFDARIVEIGEIAGWIHDIGNCISRVNHGLTGANLAFPILMQMGMRPDEIATIISAIGSHEEQTGIAVNAVSAALILADKSDAHRTRVRKGQYDPDDIHDRVNYSIKKNYLVVDKKNKKIKLVIFMDHNSSPMEYFQIYLSRMILSEKAAQFLECKYELIINDVVINNRSDPSEAFYLKKTETAVGGGES